MLCLNKAKRAACLRAAALRGRAARKPAPTTPRRAAPTTPRRPTRIRKPAPTTPRRPAPTTPCQPPPSALRAQSCLGCIKSALTGRSSKKHSCLPLPPVAVVYAQQFVAALIAKDKQ
ncbi:uncharacterized protein BDR25DRAFT_319594 [Lindgomyces ingoldianus]|uniref:Uncharacterized protein n=1 Tax=Lindgomyces ingoldianus TaxID=673940 RepID=A0ACB6QA71_9PLEO|nr:uncharacterized protein BDR25DRAFT_319594 [Lindgomyces ingoldianus]KAF2463934.1 hypothetical protein BDR25DRAFT_319594 [Lindgomyces ingoldianus]